MTKQNITVFPRSRPSRDFNLYSYYQYTRQAHKAITLLQWEASVSTSLNTSIICSA